MRSHNNGLALAFFSLVWATVIVFVAYNAYTKITDDISAYNLKMKTMDDLLNANP